MKKRTELAALMLCMVLAACGGGRKNEWDIDYSSVYRAYEGRQYDNSYSAPSVIGCVDDDLYNCQ